MTHDSGDTENNKKDLTGIHDLQKLQAENPETMEQIPEDPFTVNTEQPIAQVDHFESIDEMTNQMSTQSNPLIEKALEAINLSDEFSEAPPLPETIMEEVKNYSESTQGRTDLEIKIHYPFHLKIQGTFGPYERDKLLLFITEYEIGLASSDLDLQLKAGRVLLPRISEFAAVKLVQELRDSELTFQLHPSDLDEDDSRSMAAPLSYHFQNEVLNEPSLLSEVRILSEGNHIEIDQVSIVQYVKTEMLEVENSPMIQEVIDRMTEALKQKALLKGGNALFNLQKEITPLRLPSQYQISLKAGVVRQ